MEMLTRELRFVKSENEKHNQAMKNILVTLFLTISFGCFGQTEPTTDSIINNIKKQYHFIQDNLKSYNTAKIEDPATAYYEGNQIKLIVFGEAEKYGVDYYFSNGQLFFAIDYNYDIDKKSVVSNQYYFSNGKLILWLDNDQKKVDLSLGTNSIAGQGLKAHSSKIKDEFKK
jgi:hypothetical protein